MRKFFILLPVLIFTWFLLSGIYSPLLISLGFFSIFFTLYLIYRFNFLQFNHKFDISLISFYFLYIPWLLKEIFISGLKTSYLILFSEKRLKSKFSFVKSTQTTDSGKVIFANSITLTPGTVSVQINENEILVHALVEESIEELSRGEMDTRVTLLERPK